MIGGIPAVLLAAFVVVQPARPASPAPVASEARQGLALPTHAPSAAGAKATTGFGERFPSTAEEVIAKVEAFEASVRDMQVKFVQTTVLRATAESSEMTGELAMVKTPERFKLSFTKPMRQTAVFDGRNIILYYPETGQAFRQRASRDDISRLIGVNPAAPVRSMGTGRRARLVGCGGDGCRLAFEGDNPGMSWRILVSATDWSLLNAEYENEEIRIKLSCLDYRVNRGLAPGKFRDNLPPGTEVIEGIPGFVSSVADRSKPIQAAKSSPGKQGSGSKANDKSVTKASPSPVASDGRKKAE